MVNDSDGNLIYYLWWHNDSHQTSKHHGVIIQHTEGGNLEKKTGIKIRS